MPFHLHFLQSVELIETLWNVNDDMSTIADKIGK